MRLYLLLVTFLTTFCLVSSNDIYTSEVEILSPAKAQKIDALSRAYFVGLHDAKLPPIPKALLSSMQSVFTSLAIDYHLNLNAQESSLDLPRASFQIQIQEGLSATIFSKYFLRTNAYDFKHHTISLQIPKLILLTKMVNKLAEERFNLGLQKAGKLLLNLEYEGTNEMRILSLVRDTALVVGVSADISKGKIRVWHRKGWNELQGGALSFQEWTLSMPELVSVYDLVSHEVVLTKEEASSVKDELKAFYARRSKGLYQRAFGNQVPKSNSGFSQKWNTQISVCVKDKPIQSFIDKLTHSNRVNIKFSGLDRQVSLCRSNTRFRDFIQDLVILLNLRAEYRNEILYLR